MRRRTHISLVVQSSFFGAMALMAGPDFLEAKVHAQAAPPAFKQREVKLKDKAKDEKEKEKKKAISNKGEKPDFAPIEEYYRDYLLPTLTQDSPEQINLARKDILSDMEAIERNKELVPKYNTYFIKEMRDLALKGADGKTYSPTARINAAVLIGRMSPEAMVQKTILEFIDQKENDGVLSSGLSSLLRHVKSPLLSEQVRGRFVQSLQSTLTSPAPLTRDSEAHYYLTSQTIDCLTEIAKLETDKDKEKGPSKLATAALTPALIKIIDEQKSEWLVESALASFGTIKHTTISAEDAVVLEKAIAKFIKKSTKDWKKRIANSGASGAGGDMGMGMGMGSSMGMPGSGGGGPKKGGASSSSSSGGEGPEMGEFGKGGGGGGTKPKKEEQPKEVKNARRIAHQRFEKIHLALNGLALNAAFQKRPIPDEKDKEKGKAEKALLAFLPAPEKEKVTKLIEKIDQFQKDLNDEKINDLNSLNASVKKSILAVRTECDEILGEKKEVVIEKDDDSFGQ
ncbi:MAG: hypothetical protein NTY15_13485 [Planctomycetota bacterium]|nr:hypothetical protein [Planctomycetota bacterium]